MPIGGGFCRWSSRGATKTFVRNQTSNTTTYALGKGTGMIPGRDLASSQYRALPRERLGLCNDRPPGLSHPGFRTITIARKSPLVGLLRDKYVYPRRQPITSDHWQSEISARARTHTHTTRLRLVNSQSQRHRETPLAKTISFPSHPHRSFSFSLLFVRSDVRASRTRHARTTERLSATRLPHTSSSSSSLFQRTSISQLSHTTRSLRERRSIGSLSLFFSDKKVKESGRTDPSYSYCFVCVTSKRALPCSASENVPPHTHTQYTGFVTDELERKNRKSRRVRSHGAKPRG